MRIAAAVVAFFALTGSARAETAAPWDTGCDFAEAVVPGALPANVTGIPILGPVDMITASLLAADGTVVDTKLLPDEMSGGAHSILVPLAALTVGQTYTVRWSDECSGYRTKTFVATASIPLPSTAGTAVVTDYGYENIGNCDTLGRPILTRSRSVFLLASPDMKPWLAISDVDLIVDGAVYDSGRTHTWGSHVDGVAVDQLHLSCPGPTENHQFAVRIRLPNGPTFSTPNAPVQLACLDKGDCLTFGGDTPYEDAGVNDDPGVNDGGAPAPAASNDDIVRAGCNCHYSRGEFDGALWVFAVGAALAMRRKKSG
jgi:hypothetical protein